MTRWYHFINSVSSELTKINIILGYLIIVSPMFTTCSTHLQWLRPSGVDGERQNQMTLQTPLWLNSTQVIEKLCQIVKLYLNIKVGNKMK